MLPKQLKSLLFAAAAMACVSTAQAQFPETFDGPTFPPTGWASFIGANGTGTVENWEQNTTNTYNASAGAAFVLYEATGSPNEDWLVTPQVTITASNSTLVFYEREQFTTNYNTNYSVRVSTTSQTDPATFTTVVSYGETTTPDFNTYRLRTVDLSAYIGQSIYVGFVMTQDDGDNWYIEDVNFLNPNCLIPTTLATANITSSSADLSWTSTGSSFQVSLAASGAGAAAGTMSMVTATSTSFTGLTDNTTYDAYVRLICAPGDTTAWAGPVTFTTLCNAYNVPWMEGFENVANVPAGDVLDEAPTCMSFNNYLTANGTLTGIPVANTGARTGNQYGLLLYQSTTADGDYLFTPGFNMNAGTDYVFSFWYKVDDQGVLFDSLRVRMGSAATVAGMTMAVGNTIVQPSNDSAYVEFSATVTPASTGVYYFGLNSFDPTGNPWFIMVDDMMLDSVADTTQISINQVSNSETPIRLFPNPTRGSVQLQGLPVNARIAIINTLGQVVSTVEAQNETETLDLSTLAPALYMIRIEDKEGNVVTMPVTRQ